MSILRDISVIWSFIFVLIIFALLFESRYSRKKTTLLTFVFMLPLGVINTILFILLGPETAAQLILLTCTIPSLVFFLVISKHRDGRFFFTFCFADTISYELIFITSILDHYFFGDQYIFMLISRMICFPLIALFIQKFLRRSYLSIQQTVLKGWWVFSLISMIFYLLLVILSSYPTIFYERPENMPVNILVMILLPLLYLNIFQVLLHQKNLFLKEEESRMLSLQSSLLSQHAESIAKANEEVRIIRHDIHHQLSAIAVMLNQGKIDDALQYLNTTDVALQQTKTPHWCENPILDAVFAAYFTKAAQLDIRIDANISIPKDLPLDAADLSTVFANALENAINACAQLSPETRYIRCKCLADPQFMFKISNPYAGNVLFDENHLPISSQSGHGIGTRSILAFCSKHGAECKYKAENNIFSLCILIM